MQLIWKALLALSGHTIVVAGGLLFAVANLVNIDLSFLGRGDILTPNGLEVMLQLLSVSLVIVGMLIVRASTKFKHHQDGQAGDKDLLYFTDPFYQPRPRI